MVGAADGKSTTSERKEAQNDDNDVYEDFKTRCSSSTCR